MRIILDTNVFVSALRSNAGASRHLLRAIFEGKVRCITSTALWMEYEDLIHRPIWGDSTTLAQREALLDALASQSEWVGLYFNWQPNLRDEGDNFLIELAIAGNVDAIATHNIKDLKSGELVFPNLRIVTPDVFFGATDMTTLTLRLPNETAQRLKMLAKQQGKSLNKLFEQLSVQTLANWDVENRFKVRAARADKQQALAILDELDAQDRAS